jgi:KaiC/GvpD/RAD55 family RecA-like ATPase
MKIERVKSGIAGFDDIVSGGLPKAYAVLLSGPVGSYKLPFALEFLYRSAAAGERTLYASFEKTERDLVEKTAGFEWNFEEQVKNHNIAVLTSELFNWGQYVATLEDQIFNTGATKMVLDSTTFLSEFFDAPIKLRTSLLELKKALDKRGVTSLWLSETRGDELSDKGVEEFLVDGTVKLHAFHQKGQVIHGISIPSMAGVEHSENIHPLELTAKGLRVHRIPLVL